MYRFVHHLHLSEWRVLVAFVVCGGAGGIGIGIEIDMLRLQR